jgi:hypothetical protein
MGGERSKNERVVGTVVGRGKDRCRKKTTEFHAINDRQSQNIPSARIAVGKGQCHFPRD